MKPNWRDSTKEQRAEIITQAVKERLIGRDIAALFEGATTDQVTSFCCENRIKMVPRTVASGKARRKVTLTSSTVVRQFYEIADRDEVQYLAVAKRAGVHPVTLTNWRGGQSPRLSDFENAAQAIGYRITLVPIVEAAEK